MDLTGKMDAIQISALVLWVNTGIPDRNTFQVPESLLPIQLPATVHGKVADGSNVCAPAIQMGEPDGVPEAFSFSLAHPWLQ